MPTVTSKLLHRGNAKYPPAYWEEFEKCPAVTMNADGTAEINYRDPAYLAFLRKWNPNAPKPAIEWPTTVEGFVELAKSGKLMELARTRSVGATTMGTTAAKKGCGSCGGKRKSVMDVPAIEL